MKKIIVIVSLMLSLSAYGDDNAAEKYGIEKQRTDTVNTRTDITKRS